MLLFWPEFQRQPTCRRSACIGSEGWIVVGSSPCQGEPISAGAIPDGRRPSHSASASARAFSWLSGMPSTVRPYQWWGTRQACLTCWRHSGRGRSGTREAERVGLAQELEHRQDPRVDASQRDPRPSGLVDVNPWVARTIAISVGLAGWMPAEVVEHAAAPGEDALDVLPRVVVAQQCLGEPVRVVSPQPAEIPLRLTRSRRWLCASRGCRLRWHLPRTPTMSTG